MKTWPPGVSSISWIVHMLGWSIEPAACASCVKRSREAGFDHHVVKPADIDVIKRLLGAVDLAPAA